MSRSNDIAGLTTSILDGVTATEVGLGNVDNTSDANKPVSTAQQSAIDLKANIASPTFTGTTNVSSGVTLPSNPTIQLGTNTTYPTGHIIQYKNVVVTGLSAQSHQSNTEAATSITASITPKKTGSKIHVICTFISGTICNSGAGITAWHYLKRTGSSVSSATLGVTGGSDAQYNIYFEAGVRTSNAQNVFPVVLSIPDTPGHSNTTDAITYTVFVNGVSGSGTLAVQVNKSGSRDANFTFLETVG